MNSVATAKTLSKRELSQMEGNHCLVAGGSAGLGLELGKLLASKGCNVTILARGKDQLQAAVESINDYVFNSSQKIQSISADCCDPESITSAILGIEPVSMLFCCVGMAKPQLFMDYNISDFSSQMNVNYLSAVYAVRAVLPKMLSLKQKCRIVFVSSLAGLVGFAGYSAYSPAKAALKAFADCLRHELVRSNVHVSVFLPGSFDSPGYEQEEKIKPKITKKVEEMDQVISASKCAKLLLDGVLEDKFLITTSFTGELIRCGGLVHSPRNSIFDFFKACVSFIVLPFWRKQLDSI